MGLFSRIFEKKEGQPVVVAENENNKLQEMKRSEAVEEPESITKDNNVVKIQYGTQMPIDIIYAFIERDYENEGYQDAMCNPDDSYKESKKAMIKHGLKRLFEQVGLRYKSDLRNIEVQITIMEQQGMANTASTLQARKDTLLEHLSIMGDMEAALDREEQKMMSMIKSYERGFLKGLAAKSDLLLRNGNI